MRLSSNDHLNFVINDMLIFEEELQCLALKIYPSESLRKLITNELLPIVKELKGILEKDKKDLEENKISSMTSKAKAVHNIWFTSKVKMIANAISSADLKSHPIEIMNVFRDLIKDIDSSDFEIITTPVQILNFSFSEVWLPFKEELRKIGIVRPTDKKFIKLTFPKEHKDNIFLAGIYAHEIGHYFDRNNKIWVDVLQNALSNKKVIQLKQYFLKNGNIISDAELPVVMINSVLRSWIMEAIADCVGVYLLGPAFIYSCLELDISTDGRYIAQYDNLYDIASATHPRSGLRYRFQYNLLKGIGLYDCLDDKLKKILDDNLIEWENSTPEYIPSTEKVDKNTILLLNKNSYEIFEEIWQECLNEVEQRVHQLVGTKKVTTSIIDEAMELSEGRLMWLIPPNEINGKAASAQAIINAGWFTKYLYKDNILSLVSSIEDENTDFEFNKLINGLLRYALHASYIQGRWQ